ncbi:hypothetical protein A6F68_02877 [Tsuneonella dongtanensis]|uniref:Uncharacterized protein n=1 Tax=Tsuneonella dongtanensis TaxID=692370 RepID=A0A1B2AH31_9SPHN|nr:hypothetical protein [Tsuneonella dongtanensis]ANY21365.1 hypothetical protein A6F68_02877 [Tsuneonella dongtanensis]
MLRIFNWQADLKRQQRGSRRQRDKQSRFEALYMSSHRKSRERTETAA